MKEISLWCDKCTHHIDGARSMEQLKKNAKNYLKIVGSKHFHKSCWEEMTAQEKKESLKN